MSSLYQNNQWVGYDDPSSAVVKANYIVNNNLGGAMFWDLPSDDFRHAATFYCRPAATFYCRPAATFLPAEATFRPDANVWSAATF